MEKYRAINGWSKETMKLAIMVGNNGTVALNIWGKCTYLSPSGNRCAVGCFIPTGHPGQKDPGSVVGILSCFPDLVNQMPLDQEGLLAMQGTHDGYRGDSDVRDMLCAWIDANVIDHRG